MQAAAPDSHHLPPGGIMVELPEPPCSHPDLRCLSNRLLWWAQSVYPRPLELLLFAAARWCASRGLGCSALFQRLSGLYALADRIERLHAE